MDLPVVYLDKSCVKVQVRPASRKQYEGLKTLADYIESEVGPEHFDMSCYRSNLREGEEHISYDKFYSFSECGTLGCAVGWIPWAFKMTEEDLKPFMEGEDDLFKNEVKPHLSFYGLALEKLGLCPSSDLGDYLFASSYGTRNDDEGDDDFDFEERIPGHEQKRLFLERAREILGFWKSMPFVEVGEL